MCGISGFCNFEQSYLEQKPLWENVLTNMHTSLSHRGDDRLSTYLRPHIGLSRALYPIENTADEHKTMLKQIERFPYAISCNGEIYNTDELIPILSAAGYSFRTCSDAEVILYAYLHYGPEFVSRLNGIFSLAIWDGKAEQLFLCRDHIGTKPLFYSIKGSTLIFGSEPKALFCHPDVRPSINLDSLREILGIGPARTPGVGIFCGMHEVIPGHYMIFSKTGQRDHLYWDLTSVPHTDSYADTVDKVSFLVRDSIRRQTISDTPICSFLSGGIDSSIVTAAAAGYLREQGKSLNTFSFDFKENDIYFQSNTFQPERDLPYVNLMLKHCPTNHTFLECDPTTLADTLYTAVDARDLPGMTDIDASLLYFCSLVKKHSDVALTGECADEIFGGYPWFYRSELLNRDGFPWAADMSVRSTFLNQDLCQSLQLSKYSHNRYQESIAKVPLLSGESKEEQKRRSVAYLNIKWFMQTLLDRMDRASMYCGLKARVPFADHRIMEYLFNVPWEMKYQNGVEKTLLRDACADLLPPELLHRKKSPYPKTYHPGYEKLLAERLSEIADNPNAPIAPLIDRKKAKQFMASHTDLSKPWFGQLMAGPQLMAYFIQINYWMEKYHLSV